MQEIIVNYVLIFSIILLLTITLLISFRRKVKGNTPALFLVAMYWVYLYALITVFIFDFGWIEYFPHLFRTIQIAALIYPVLSYFYVSLTLHYRPLKFLDLLHLLPAILFLADYSPFFITSADEKIQLFQHLKSNQWLQRFDEGLIMPPGGHLLMRYLVMIGYWMAQCVLIIKLFKSETNTMPRDQRILIRWLIFLTASQFIMIFPPLLNFSFNVFPVGYVNGISTMVAAIIQAYFLFFHPEILYGYFGNEPQRVIIPEDISKKPKKRDSTDYVHNQQEINDSSLQSWMGELAERLEHFLKQNRPFMQQGYGLSSLARDLDCSNNHLSYLVNNFYGVNFNKFINKFRIEACIEKIKNREFQNKTLEAIANECGFSSRSTFINAFKVETGFTPSDFIKDFAGNPV